MLKPDVFQQPYVVFRNVPYQGGDGAAADDVSSGGVLASGQTVWTQEPYNMQNRPQTATAFVEEIGIISINPRWLVRADVLSH